MTPERSIKEQKEPVVPALPVQIKKRKIEKVKIEKVDNEFDNDHDKLIQLVVTITRFFQLQHKRDSPSFTVT
jgi:hypothetical protein